MPGVETGTGKARFKRTEYIGCYINHPLQAILQTAECVWIFSCWWVWFTQILVLGISW